MARSTTRFQLVFSDAKEYERHKALVENSALVSGQLFVGHTGHHHTKALIEVRDMRAAGGKLQNILDASNERERTQRAHR